MQNRITLSTAVHQYVTKQATTMCKTGTGSELDGRLGAYSMFLTESAASRTEDIDIRQPNAMFSCDTPISRQWAMHCTCTHQTLWVDRK